MSRHRLPAARRAMAGFILIPVVATLAILAAVGHLMNREAALGLSAARGDYEADRARYIAEAGLNHTLFKLADGSCSGSGADLTDVPFDGGTYTTVVTAAGANRVNIKATGTLPGGISRSLGRLDVVLMGSSSEDDTLQPGPGGKDTYVNAQGTNQNYGASDRLVADTSKSQHSYPLVEFDLSMLPAAASIQSARLELNLDSYAWLGPSARLAAHRMRVPWTENTATWSTSDGSTAWSWPAAYDPSAVDDTPADPTSGSWHVWDLTGVVQDWHQGTVVNAGVAIIGNAEVTEARFVSGDDADAGRWPRLILTYACTCGQTCGAGHYRDEFNTRTCDDTVDYAGSDGSLDWSPWAWTEEGEGNGSCNGGLRVDTDSYASGDYVVRLTGSNNALVREADLSGFSNATLSFDYRRENLSDPTDVLEVAVSPDGSGWTLVDQIMGPATDAAYQQASYDISTLAGGAVHVRLKASISSTALSEAVFVDNVEIRDEGGSGPPPPPPETPVEADAYVDESDPDANFGSSATLSVGRKKTGPGKLYASVLRFDLSSIPAGSTVSSATVRLHQVSSAGTGTVTMPLYHINAAWTEAGITWNTLSDGGVPHATTDVALGVADWFEWSLPPGLVHEWIDGVTPNDGVVIRPSGAYKGQIAEFASRDYATPGFEPQLIVVYTPP